MNDRACADCGAIDRTVVVESSGTLLCSLCWLLVLAAAARRSPSTPTLDAHMARIEQAERGEAAGPEGAPRA